MMTQLGCWRMKVEIPCLGPRLLMRAAACSSALLLLACGAQAPGASPPAQSTAAGPPVSSAAPAEPSPAKPTLDPAAEPAAPGGARAGAPATEAVSDEPSPKPPCPEGMVHVQKDFCPKLQRVCLKSEYDKPNHITICHEFAEGNNRCLAERVALDFCIDRYEYPNQKGGHPPWMVDWDDAKALCAEQGKRLCYESEWVSACEGPEEKPFPYGWARSKQHCNIDNRWLAPDLRKVYSDNPALSRPELERLDQSVPSGSLASCVSDYGVYDLTGNFDEWVHKDPDSPTKRGDFVALKGGAWGHVRNACRPVTTSHDARFRYYFVSLRCCRDAADR